MDITGATGEPIGHLGLVAATIQDSGLMEVVDRQLGVTEGSVKHGHRVGAMILNGLGFINTALYMTPRFFHDKPLDLLLGKGLSAEQLNDDCLGRCLDKIASYGTTKWYSEIALEVVRNAGLLSRMAHLDSTTLSLYGSYDRDCNDTAPKPLLGFSKDHRPDLKQVTLQCVSLGKSALPIWMEALDGNSSDKKNFPETVKKVNNFYKEIESAPEMCFVADSALYGNSLDELDADWLTRVPENYNEARLLCNKSGVEWIPSSDARYHFCEYLPEGKSERWLLVRSEPSFKRENKTFLRRHEKVFSELQKILWHCSCQKFNCENDARKAMEKAVRSKKHYYDVTYDIYSIPFYEKKGRPAIDQKPDGYMYQARITGISSNLASILKKRETLGRFVLATNIISKEKLPAESMLLDYKDQSEIERGFRFIKNDTFGLDEIYLKKPERIGALMAIMTLCLLVYGLAQYRLRDALKQHNEFLPDQKKKPTSSPTLMWIFTLFSSVIMVNLKNKNQKNRILLNLHPLHQKIILLFGKTAQQIYLLPEQLSIKNIELNQKTWLAWCGM